LLGTVQRSYPSVAAVARNKPREGAPKSMSWAKSVLPVFMGDSSEKLRIAPDSVQIDTTHFRLQVPAKSALSRKYIAVNRTAVILYTSEGNQHV
jgi:hypothetical protein